MLASERRVGGAAGAKGAGGFSLTTRAADLSPTAAWSRRVRWVGGLIRAAFAALWLGHRVSVPRYRPVGWALTLGPVILVIALSGTALVATTGLGAGILLLGTALAGFCDLAAVRQAAQRANAEQIVVPVSAGARA